MKRTEPRQGEFYKHFKGNIYQIRDIAKDSETEETMVVYQGMYAPYTCWVRTLDEFMSLVDKKKYPNTTQEYRFEIIQEETAQGKGKEVPATEKRVQQKMEKAPSKENTNEVESVVSEAEFAKAIKSGQPDKYLAGRMSEDEIAQQGFMLLLDVPTFEEKRQIFVGLKKYLDKHFLGNIAVALDIVLEDGDKEEQYDAILHCLDAFEHYEGGRLR